MNFYKIIDVKKYRPLRYEVVPDFLIMEDPDDPSKDEESLDLMIRGGGFYAVWDDQRSRWITNPKTVQRIIDADILKKTEEIRDRLKANGTEGVDVIPMLMENFSSGSWQKFNKYTESLPDHFHQLDQSLTFKSTKTVKSDYSSKRLEYDLCDGDISAYEELVSTLYEPEERAKFEWAIGSILAGDSKVIQKFIVFHGPMGTGKSTIMNLIEKLFGGYGKKGYCAKINAQALVGGNVGFALTPFAKAPLVGIDQDSKLSRIEDNTILNQVVSHDTLQIDQKYKDLFESSAQCMLFMGTNEPVKITNSKSGIIRRLIDVEPTGKTISPESRYEDLVRQMDYNLGAIAKHCLDVYKKMGKSYYSKYVPRRMMMRTDPFFNFMYDQLEFFELHDSMDQKNSRDDYITADIIWAQYRKWCDDSGMDFKLKRYQVIDEAKNYFKNYDERIRVKVIDSRGNESNAMIRSVYSGLRKEKFQKVDLDAEASKLKAKLESAADDIPEWLQMKSQHSILDDELADCPAQYGDEKPKLFWKDVTTKLKDLNTRKTHYVQMKPQMIQIDCDKKDMNGNKNFKLNVMAIKKLGLPPSYAERSKGGEGIHVAYYWDGNVEDLNLVVEEDVEVKIQIGNSALRRRLSECNNLPIAHISSGLPIRRKKKVINDYALKDVKHLHNKIMMALRKEVEPKATRTSMMYIRDCLKEAQEKGIEYDFSQLDNIIYSFAANSSNSADFCLNIYKDLKLKWPEDVIQTVSDPVHQIVQAKWADEAPIIIFDVETFKNMFMIVYKELGPNKRCGVLINPKPYQLEPLFKMRLVGFNNRGYDNFLVWAAYLGYTNAQLYDLSQEIIIGGNRMPLRDAVNISFTDIYDYCSTKQGLKKWEIAIERKREKQIERAKQLQVEGKTYQEISDILTTEDPNRIVLPAEYVEAYLNGTLKILEHKELDWPWDKDIPEEMWDECARYCMNDVLATEQLWLETQSDFKAREILADISGGTPNDTTNQLTAKFIFEDAKEPWNTFVYPDLKAKFPGYRFEFGKSYYRHDIKIGEPWAENYDAYCKRYGKQLISTDFLNKTITVDEIIGEGGRVYANPGMYRNVKTFDVASMHPSSIIAENGFGPYTKRFKEIMDIRIAIKHKDFESARKMLDGKLAPYLNDPAQAKQLSFALKIAINSVYGLTAAKFQNKFKDPRNVDNWVAKRGALFIETLRLKVQDMGATVVHIKTDSIKIADPMPEVEQFILKYGKEWGYNFEVESIYDRICLVNDAVYIAKCTDDPENGDEAGHWTATGAQFAHPYVFKTLFSKEKLDATDLCETKNVNTAIYLDMNENLPDVEQYEKELEKIQKNLKKLGCGIDIQTGRFVISDVVPEDSRAKAEEQINRIDVLTKLIASGHDYHFVGKTGSFCPIIPGKGGGWLMRSGADGKYGAVGGTKGYRWLESDWVKQRHYEEFIDMAYFRELADVAIETIGAYGSFEMFVNGESFSNSSQEGSKSNIAMAVKNGSYITTMKMPHESRLPIDMPWKETPCGSSQYAFCCDCPHYYDEMETCCKLGYNITNQIITY